MNTLKKVIWLQCKGEISKATEMIFTAPDEVYNDLLRPYVKFCEGFADLMYELEINY